MASADVRLDVIAVGKDQVTAMLRQVDAQVRKTAAEMKTAGAATAEFGEKIDGLKDSAKPLDKVRGLFENLRSNAMFVVSGIGALAGAFVALTEVLSSNSLALREWEEARKAIFEGIIKPPKLLDEIAEYLGKKLPTAGTRLVDKIREQWGDLNKSIQTSELGLLALQQALDESRDAGTHVAKGYREKLQSEIDAAKTALSMLREDRAALEQGQLEVQQKITKELEEQGRLSKGVVDNIATVLNKLAQTGASLDDPSKGLAARLFGKGAGTGVAGKPPRSRGGGPRDDFDMGKESADLFAEFMATNQAAYLNVPEPVFDTDDQSSLDAILGNARDTSTSRSRAELDALAESLRKTTPLTEQFAQAFENVADALSAVSAELPEVVSGFGELTTITTNYAEQRASIEEGLEARLAEIREMNLTAADQAAKEKQAQDDATAKSQSTLTQALAAGGTAIAANAAKAIGGVRAEAAVRAAYEVGMGFATLGTPVIAAGHFTAAALLGAVAAGAGGGRGGGRAGGSSRGERGDSGSGGPSTIVYNFSTLVTDRQQVTSAIRQSQRSSRGTGLDTRAGV